MKNNFEMLGVFCDNCGSNLTFANHISENKYSDGTKMEVELDFCDTNCYEKYLRKNENKNAERFRKVDSQGGRKTNQSRR